MRPRGNKRSNPTVNRTRRDEAAHRAFWQRFGAFWVEFAVLLPLMSLARYVYLVLVLTLPILPACSGFDSKENFANFQNSEIGRRGDQSWRYRQPESESRTLANGNTEHKYRYPGPRGTCIFFREFDGNTGRLVGWRIDGDDEGCRIVP